MITAGFARVRGLLVTLGLGIAPLPAVADIYGLVIGIDAYQRITPLHGAVNDARDISDALGQLNPAELVVLYNGQATRDRVMQTWRRFAQTAGPEDTIIVTYAGHGSNEPAAYPDNERDGRDETLLLAGFYIDGPGAGERIRDDEIAELIAATRATTVFVADSCHSGTATRGTNDKLTYRFYDHAGLVDDPLPPPPPPPNTRQDMAVGRDAIFFGAVADSEKAPEVEIGGQIRGALSYAFADGLRGRADRNGDGTITKGEMETHVRRFVKQELEGRQKPQVYPAGDIFRPLIGTKGASDRPPTGFALDFADLPPVAVQLIPSPDIALNLGDLHGVIPKQVVAGRGLIIDLPAREIRSGGGDRLRAITQEIGADPVAQAQGMVNKMRAIHALKDGALSGDLDVELLYGDDVYFDQDPVTLMIFGRKERHVTVIGMPPDGTVNLIYPRYPPLDQSGDFLDPETLAPDERLEFDTEALPPFGTEHVLVIETPVPHPAVRRAAARFEDQPYIDRFWTELHTALAGRPHSIGLHGFITYEEK